MKTSVILTAFARARTLWSLKSFTKSSIARNTTILLGGDASARIISLLAMTLTVRTLGTTTFGVLVLAETYAKLLDRIFTFQSWAPLIRFGAIAIRETDPGEIKGYIRLGYTLDCISAVTGFLVAYFLAPIVGRFLGWGTETISACKLYSFLILFNATGTSTGILRLTDNFSLLAFQRFLYSLIRVTGVTLATLYRGGLTTFLSVWLVSECAGYVFLNICAQYVLNKKGWKAWWASSLKSAKKPFVAFALWTNVTSTIDIPLKFLDVFFISYFVSLEATGIYKIFQQISHVLKKPTEPLIQVLYPHFSNLNAGSNHSRLISSAVKAVVVTGSLAFTAALILSASSSMWFPRILGVSLQVYALEFTIFMFLQAYTVAVTPLSPLMVACGLVRQNFLIQGAANLAFLACIGILGPRFGLMGVIVSTGIPALLSSAFRMLTLIRTLSPEKRRKP